MGNTSGVLRDDARFGAYQKFCLVPAHLTSKVGCNLPQSFARDASFCKSVAYSYQIGETPFPEAANLSTAYAPACAFVLHLGLNRPQIPEAASTGEKVLIWGVSSSLGAIATQMAAHAGYTVVGVASGRHAEVAESLGISHFVDRTSSDAVLKLTSVGPFKTVFAAADSAEDQVKIGEVLAAQGGGSFLSTMGVRSGVKLPPGVSGWFVQYLDDFVDPKNRDFVEWVWWDYLEKAVSAGKLKSVPVEVKGGLNETKAAWSALKAGQVSGKRLIIQPDVE